MYEFCFPFILLRKPGAARPPFLFGNAAQELSIIFLEDVPYANKFIYAESVSDVTTCAGDLYLKHAMC
jgi:hypothetical protein